MSLASLKQNRFLVFLSSLKITVIGLFLLFILTLWGTIAQVDNGLYASQQRYFSSFYFLAMGFLPFPGAQLVLWVLFINLVAALFTSIRYAWSQVGLIIVHYGLIIFLVAAFGTFHQSRESHLTLHEGQSANVSESYNEWEIAFWRDTGSSKTVTAFDFASLAEGSAVSVSQDGLNLKIKTLYQNAQAFSAPFAGIKERYINVSGINIIKAVPLEKEPEKNMPGVILQVMGENNLDPVLLYGGESEPTKIALDKSSYSIILRHKHYPLPVTIRLIDFIMEKHPGTEVARSYKSRVAVENAGNSREVVISMNEPLRFKEFTFYQSSYQIDQMGREISTLAVVQNASRILPYIATFVTFFGLALHFLLAAFNALKLRRL